jgi:hypothetical protein
LKYRSLALFPVVLALILAAAALALGDRLPTLVVQNEAGKVLALVGCAAAALAFERGDYLRRAWLAIGTCYLLLLVNDGLGASDATAGMGLVRGIVVTVANASSVVGTWMLAHAWSVAGLDEEDDDRRRRHAMLAGAIVLALAITGWPLVNDVRNLASGHLEATVSIASDLGDAIVLALVAPVMHTALAMRGGLLRWPWGLLTVSGLAWLAYDASSGVIDALKIGPGVALVASEALRVLANGYVFGAGVAQRMAVAPGARESVPPPA